MNFYSIALTSEARPLIDKLKLKKIDEKKYNIYESKDTKLIITGQGSVNSSIATTYLLTKYKASLSDSIYNIGLAGANFECKIGDSFFVKKVIDSQTGSIITTAQQKGKKIVCYPAPTTKCKVKNSLVDMESYGFLKSALKFIDKKNIHLLKVVSDFLETKLLSSKEVYELIYSLALEK